ncbi:hypothetical protein T9A_02699 [Alcanivorax jadensis T9]|jgi:hypothetical protein|uniref:Uncharacterized protein n=1 Tax=Alcanivorax jadensis T9 TaxID=1177181 RepID=A0ABR4WB84_9GAMM|nr:hypothetical protein [Alcanivorax jadensis]KGD60306.1 hypothetical protein T9A_02699 [Alcanivorax jadensis T9]MBP22337.1 hypothetical protein [Alcanivorax sp.]|tara:strand:+ start:690 stop:1109 length:420 start_codon:yes stop_codon:yes gene_type:complete
MTDILQKNVKSAFSNLIDEYSFKVREVDESSVVLVGSSYAIGVLLDRDGLAYMYYDISKPTKKGYNLGLFLIQKRRDLLVFGSDDKSDRGLEEYLSYNLSAFANQLTSAGKDILHGEKAWIKSYHWPAVTVSDKVLAVL